MKNSIFKLSPGRQYFLAVFIITTVASLCFLASDIIDYRIVALVLLFTLSILSIFINLLPALIAALLSALILDFFFIPPHYTLHIDTAEDFLLLMMYFIIALLNGIFTTRIRKFEKENSEKEEKLNALKLYSTIYNSVSHEIRTPITTILGVSESLTQNESNLDKEKRVALYHEIKIAGSRLNKLVDKLLNISRIESGLLKPAADWCDIHELLYSTAHLIKEDFGEMQITIIIRENFPLYKLDFGLVQQAIFNILHNSAIHAHPGVKVTVGAIDHSDFLQITIRDDGPGIPREKLAGLFERSSVQENRKKGCLGLGLSISQGFITAHKGKIIAKNSIPNGIEFTIEIPAEKHELRNDYE
jgi:two-component system sensor histidine kinase KdpD